MLGETVHAYILTPALAIAVPRPRSSTACRGGWGEAVEPTAIAVGCSHIAPHGACRAETDMEHNRVRNAPDRIICRENFKVWSRTTRKIAMLFA